MSVINKLLRDLDKRKHTTPTATSLPELNLRSGTASVPTFSNRAPNATTRWRSVIAPGMLIIAALLVWEWQTGDLEQIERVLSGRPRPMPVAPLPMVAPPPPVLQADAPEQAASAPQAAASAPAPATASAATPVAAASSPAPAVSPAKPPVAPAVVAAVPARAPAPAAAAAAKPREEPLPAKSEPTKAATAKPDPVAAAPRRPATSATPGPNESAPAMDPGQRQLQAARDAVAQAQTLWNTGSQGGAVDLLQQAVASTERSMVTTPGAAMTQSLVLLTREYTRLLLAQGKAGAVLDVMTRLEPQLRAEPDMWAVRANAAQRLGRHQDSVHAYLTALQSRPNEQRWLLGAAVSTAALGQTANATDLATRARAIGPISADVQTYLRQMGVNVKD